jgi:hypothetical protein
MTAPGGGLAAVGAPFGSGVPVKPADGDGGSEEPRGCGRDVRPRLPERRHVVQDPERAAVGADDHVVAVDVDVAYRGDRKVELERLPVVAIVEGSARTLLGDGLDLPQQKASS